MTQLVLFYPFLSTGLVSPFGSILLFMDNYRDTVSEPFEDDTPDYFPRWKVKIQLLSSLSQELPKRVINKNKTKTMIVGAQLIYVLVAKGSAKIGYRNSDYKVCWVIITIAMKKYNHDSDNDKRGKK